MPFNEYTKWDGSQQFQPQSAEKAFDQISEYLMQYGDQVLRNLEDIDDEDMKDLVELIQKEGFIEEDGEGKYRVSPKGLRRVQESALSNLFQTFQRDAIGKHETPAEGGWLDPPRGLEALRLWRLARESEHARDPQERDGPPGRRLSDPAPPRRLRRPRGRASDPVRHGRPDRHERLDEPVRKVRDDQESRSGLQAMVRAQYSQDTLQMVGFYSFASVMTERELLNSAPKPVSLYDSRVNLRSTSTTCPSGSRSTSPTSTPASAWQGTSWADPGRRTSRSSSSPTANRPRTSRDARWS